MRNLGRGTTAFAMALAASSLLLPASGAQTYVGYGVEQANAGQLAYDRACAACHMTNLQGSFEAPELAGPNFLNTWGGAPVSELLQFMQASMPPSGPQLSEDDYTNVIAYLLQQNGFTPGGTALVATASTPLGTRESLASQPPAVTGAPAAPARTDPTPSPAAPQPLPPLPALSWRGEVENYRPVTDQMLRSPQPGDWLMFRRTYDGWGYSPLDEITTDNIGDLELAWVWAMAEGSNQPTPLVHDGTMYLTNPGNIIQALDAATGDVIWQYTRDFPEGFSLRGFNQLRNISIYEDKILLSTTDAAPGRTRRTDRRHRMGAPGRRSRPRVHQCQRTDGRRRHRRQRHQRLYTLPGRELLYYCTRSRHRGRTLADVYRCPARGTRW